jgi:hypothetical protein
MILAQYQIPVGENICTLTFTGKAQLTADDFEALDEFVNWMERQYKRREAAPKSRTEE